MVEMRITFKSTNMEAELCVAWSVVSSRVGEMSSFVEENWDIWSDDEENIEIIIFSNSHSG